MKKRGKVNINNKKNTKKNKIKMSLFMVISFSISVYFISILYTQQISINKYNSKIEMYNTQINQNNEIIEGLNSTKIDTETDAYIEKIAREELGLVKPYEKIFIDINK